MPLPTTRRRLPILLTVAALLAPLAAVMPLSSSSAAAAVTTVARDDMTRTVSAGWGNATVGGAYRLEPTTAGSVASGRATLKSAGAGRTARATLTTLAQTDATSQIDISMPKLPASGSTAYVSHLVRHNSVGSYATRVIVTSSGTANLEVTRLNGWTATPLKNIKLPFAVQAGVPFTVLTSIAGTGDRVSVSATVWKTGATKPASPQIAVTDSSASRIVDKGTVGVSTYASGAGAAVQVAFDNLSVTTGTAVAPAPVAPPTTPPATTPPTTPAPSVPAITTTYPGKRGEAGAGKPGSFTYPVPAGAIFLATNGVDTNPGTQAKPVATLAQAMQLVKDNGTVVIRGGSYHQSVFVIPRTGVKVQPYPNEAVWFDGAETVTGWTQSGAVWVRSNWTTFFDSSPTYAKGAADSTQPGWQWLDPAKPMAAHPDQIWIDGVPLTQVGSRGAVKAGTFFVDKAAKQLVMGSDPAGKKVEASTLSKALTIRATNSEFRGIGIRRYATSVPEMGTVTADVPGIKLTDVTIQDNATTGFYTWAPDVVLTRVTASNNGLLGLGAATADRLRITALKSVDNNSQGFNRAPVSGALKIGRSRDVVVTDSTFVNNKGQGPWFDESVYNITFTDNDVVGNTGYGLVIELSEKATVANNVIAKNGMGGIFVTNSGTINIWNNTLTENPKNLAFAQDARRASNVSTPGHDPRQPLPDPTVPWIVRNVVVSNNVMDGATGDCVVCVNDWSKEFTGAKMITQSSGNLYHRTSASAPAVFAQWAQAASGTARYATFAEYVKATGRDTTSRSVDGTSVLDANHRLVSSQIAAQSQYAVAIPAAVAALSALPASGKVVGAQTR